MAGKFTALSSSLNIALLVRGGRKCIVQAARYPLPWEGWICTRATSHCSPRGRSCVNGTLGPKEVHVDHDNCLPRRNWEIPFQAEPREVPALRRVMRLHLAHWGLPAVVEAAQLCVSELVTNVIKHVGLGSPATLAVSMNGTNLRLEVRDLAAAVLPEVVPAKTDDEGGRGLALVAALAEKWGVCLTSTGKTTWCELATALETSHGHVQDHRVVRAESVLVAYGAETARTTGTGDTDIAQEAQGAVNLIADLLHWMQAHGLDYKAELERARSCFEAAPFGCAL